MPRFFINDPPKDGIITIYGEDAVHIGRSLRSRVGDELIFCRQGIDYLCKIESFTKDTVTCNVISEKPTLSEPKSRLTLYIALPKGEKSETIIQKCVELGAYRIVFFESERCIAKIGDESKAKSKLTRFTKISLEAAKQSGRGIIPQIELERSFENAVNSFSEHSLSILCYENCGENSKRIADISDEIASSDDISVMIGSEGGFSFKEAEYAVQKGAKMVWLGERILRCETAPIAMTAVIMNITGDL